MKNFIFKSVLAVSMTLPLLSHAEWASPMTIDKVTVDYFGNIQVHFAPSLLCPTGECFNSQSVLFIPSDSPGKQEMRATAVAAMLSGSNVAIQRERHTTRTNPFNTAFNDYLHAIMILNSY